MNRSSELVSQMETLEVELQGLEEEARRQANHTRALENQLQVDRQRTYDVGTVHRPNRMLC